MEKEVAGLTSYILGIISIVLGVISPLAGLVLGIIGITYGKKDKSELGKKGKTLSLIGAIISVVVLVAITIFYIYSIKSNLGL